MCTNLLAWSNINNDLAGSILCSSSRATSVCKNKSMGSILLSPSHPHSMPNKPKQLTKKLPLCPHLGHKLVIVTSKNALIHSALYPHSTLASFLAAIPKKTCPQTERTSRHVKRLETGRKTLKTPTFSRRRSRQTAGGLRTAGKPFSTRSARLHGPILHVHTWAHRDETAQRFRRTFGYGRGLKNVHNTARERREELRGTLRTIGRVLSAF